VQIGDHIRAADAGLVVGRTVAEIAAALETLCGDARRRAAMGQAGYEYCRRHFSWPAIAAEVGRMSEQIASPAAATSLPAGTP
jgi:glycosyltransferase involved in cell wall biosynthesis